MRWCYGCPHKINMTLYNERISLWDRLKIVEKPVVLYGMGAGAEKILSVLAEKEIAVRGVFANDEFVRGHSFHDFKVLTYAQAKQRFPEMIVLMAFGTHRPSVMARAEEIAAEQEFYAPDVPVCGSGLIDLPYLEAHRSKFEAVYGMLCDKPSRALLRDMLDFKLSGRLDYLMGHVTDVGEIYQTILRPGPDEIYVDAGAYDGDTAREFLRYAGGWRRMYAIEPDGRNFRKLAAQAAGWKNAVCVRAALGGATTEPQKRSTGRGSLAGGTAAERPASIDDVLVGSEATVIKYDVEGEELAALEGSMDTIRRHRPKLVVSAYHRREDLFAIPLAVRALRGDYRVYLRRRRCIPAWDLCYYFV